MKRTQIYLDEDIFHLLEKESKIKNISISEIIRRSIREKIQIRKKELLKNMYQYSKSHNVLLSDALVAACTKVNGFKLWTLNKKHYPQLTKNELISFEE